MTRRWISADGTPKPRWVLDLGEGRTLRDELTVDVEALDGVDDLSEPVAGLLQTMDRLRADVRATTGLGLRLDLYGPDPDDGHYEIGPGLLVDYYPGDDLEDFLVSLADEQSQEVSEDLAAAGRLDEARRWPHCPAHDHSLDPKLVDGVAVWRCRDNPRLQLSYRHPDAVSRCTEGSPELTVWNRVSPQIGGLRQPERVMTAQPIIVGDRPDAVFGGRSGHSAPVGCDLAQAEGPAVNQAR